jgi:hypothetical protein
VPHWRVFSAVFNFTVSVGKTIGSLAAATLSGASGTGFTSASGLQTTEHSEMSLHQPVLFQKQHQVFLLVLT